MNFIKYNFMSKLKIKKANLFFVTNIYPQQPEIYNCDKCDKNFQYKHTLKRHILEQHSEIEQIKCKICNLNQYPSRIKEHTHKCLENYIKMKINYSANNPNIVNANNTLEKIKFF